MKYRILDLDNCISDDEWRIKSIAWQQTNPHLRYLDYHLLAGFDEFMNWQLVADAQKNGEAIVIFTARPVLIRSLTVEWLSRKQIPFAHLLMRNNDDHSHSIDLKYKQLGWLASLYNIPIFDIASAFDDRQDVVDMYRKFGINAKRVAIHDTCAYTPPVMLVKSASVGKSEIHRRNDPS